MDNPPAFRETQSFSPWLLFPLQIGSVAFPAFILYASRGNLPLPAWLVLGGAFSIVFYLAYGMRLVTEVRADGLYVRLTPLPFRRVPFPSIRSAEVRTYRPILEYGGWGLRYSWKQGTAYNARGNRGVQLVLANGKRLLIGSQKPEELLEALSSRLGPETRPPQPATTTGGP